MTRGLELRRPRIIWVADAVQREQRDLIHSPLGVAACVPSNAILEFINRKDPISQLAVVRCSSRLIRCLGQECAAIVADERILMILVARLRILSKYVLLILLVRSPILHEELGVEVRPPCLRGGIVCFWAFRVSCGMNRSVWLVQKLMVARAVETDIGGLLVIH